MLCCNSGSPKFSETKCKPIVALQEHLKNATNKKVSNKISAAQITLKEQDKVEEHECFF